MEFNSGFKGLNSAPLKYGTKNQLGPRLLTELSMCRVHQKNLMIFTLK